MSTDVLKKVHGLLKHIKQVTNAHSVDICSSDCYDQQGCFEYFGLCVMLRSTDIPIEVNIPVAAIDSVDIYDIIKNIELQASRGVTYFHEGNETVH